jgi:hypothetical protein
MNPKLSSNRLLNQSKQCIIVSKMLIQPIFDEFRKFPIQGERFNSV